MHVVIEAFKKKILTARVKNFKFPPPYSKILVNVMYNTNRFKQYN